MICRYPLQCKKKLQLYMATIRAEQNKLLPKYQSLDQMRKKEAPTKPEEFCLVTKSSRQAAEAPEAPEAPESANLAALAKLTTASYEILERELRATIAALERQALRFETAVDNISQGICF